MVMIIFLFNLFLETFIGVLMVRFHDNYFSVPNAKTSSEKNSKYQVSASLFKQQREYFKNELYS